MWMCCLRYSLELHQSLILSGSSAVLDTQTLSSQLALPAPEVMSPEPLVSQAAAVSPGPVHLATAAPQSQPAVAFNQLTQIRSHSLPPSSAVATAPYHQTQIQLGNQVVQPAPVLSVLAYDSTSGTFFDARSGLASKIKGGLTLASLGKTSNKYSPYWLTVVGLISFCDVSILERTSLALPVPSGNGQGQFYKVNRAPRGGSKGQGVHKF